MFQSTRPRGARQRRAQNPGNLQSFNPRARGGRDKSAYYFFSFSRVSIHAPAGGATANNLETARSIKFQSTRPRGARLDNVGLLNTDVAFQSTRPRGARLSFHRLLLSHTRVSIHAPAGGATRTRRLRAGRSKFQSTRPRGARRLSTNY